MWSNKATILQTTPWHWWPGTAPTAVESALAETVSTKPARTLVTEGYRGIRVRVASDGADNETATITFYAVDPQEKGHDSDKVRAWYATSIGTLAVTLGTETGLAGTMVPNTYRYADTMTWTPTTFGTALLTYVSGNAADVDSTDNIAEFLLSDAGGCAGIAWRVTTYGLTAASAINLVVKMDV